MRGIVIDHKLIKLKWTDISDLEVGQSRTFVRPRAVTMAQHRVHVYNAINYQTRVKRRKFKTETSAVDAITVTRVYSDTEFEEMGF